MSIAHAQPGQALDVRPLGPALSSARTQALVCGKEVEVIRLVVPAGKEIPAHRAKGEIVVQCLEGEVAFSVAGKSRSLHAGELLYLPAGAAHSVKGVEDASLLLSILLPQKVSEAEAPFARDLELATAEENEAIPARGALLSVLQVVVLVISLALLFAVVAGNLFAAGLVIGTALVLLGCLHYWAWGRWMAPSLPQPSRKLFRV